MRPQQEHFQTLIMPDALIPQKSTSGGIQFLGDKLVSWMSKKQNCTAMSSARHRGALPLQVCAQDYENQSYDPTRTEDLPKDNLKVRKCILSIEALKNEKEMSMDKGSKIEPSKPLTQKRVQYRCDISKHPSDTISIPQMKSRKSMLREASNELLEIRHSMRMLVKVIRSQDGIDDKDNDKGSKSRSQSMKEQAYNKEQRERPRPHELNDKSNLIDPIKDCHQ
ncbi:hypothetical protein Tco_0755046 [Tanacetum coccineum]